MYHLKCHTKLISYNIFNHIVWKALNAQWVHPFRVVIEV